MGLFDAPTGAAPGAGTNLTSGSPAYQDAIVSNTARQLKPAYAKALNQTRQNWSDQGQLGGGLDKAAELGLQENYLGQLGNVATNAATQGADLAEQNRQREEQRGWQVQDRNLNMNYLQDQAHQAQANAEQAQWADLIGKGAGAVGTIYGGPLVGAAANQGVSSLMKPKQQSPSGSPYGVSGVQPAGYNANSSNPYGL